MATAHSIRTVRDSAGACCSPDVRVETKTVFTTAASKGVVTMKMMIMGVVLAVDAAAGAMMTQEYQLSEHGLILASFIGGSFGLLSMWGLFGYGSGNETTLTQVTRAVSGQALASVPTAGMLGPWLTMLIHDWVDPEGPVRIVHAIAIGWMVGLAGPFAIRMYGRQLLELLPVLAQKLAKKWSALFLAALLSSMSVVSADVFYCDPVKGSTPKNASDTTKGDGSAAKPWGTLASVFTNKLVNGADPSKGKVHAGDTIKLLTGDHGTVVMTGAEYLNTEPITVIAEEGHEPIVPRLVSGSAIKNWLFQSLIFQNPLKVIQYQRTARVSGDLITFHACIFRATPDPTLWTDDELTANCPQYGLYLTANNCRVTNCHFYGLENGAHLDCDGVLFDGNQIEYFLSDGLTHTSSNAVISNNRITDQRNIPANPYHHDGMQGWAVPGRVNRNVTICDNYVAYSTGKYQQIPPISTLKGPDAFQGISCFSGPWENIVVERNVVMAASYHGISLYACKNSAIRNNTVIDQGVNDLWVGFFYQTDPTSNVISGNIAPKYITDQGPRMERNFAFKKGWQAWALSPEIVDPTKTFTLYDVENAKFDLRILPDSPAAGKVIKTPAAGAVQ